MSFQLVSNYSPAGDQPNAIDVLTEGVHHEKPHQILLGVTGSGKTYTIANVIANVNRPTLVLAHNKTLAAQLCAEFRQFFPNNAVEYFVSYYDYYQPEAYVPQRDLYIEKESDINKNIERLRHRATRSLLSRRDVIIVASVSCIYGLGSPEEYVKGVQVVKKGDELNRLSFFRKLEHIQYERNDIDLQNGRYRVTGEVVDLYPSWEEHLIRFEFFGDEIDRISYVHPISGSVLSEVDQVAIYPATHYVVNDSLEPALVSIKQELEAQLSELRLHGKELEAQRLEQRTRYDMEMMREMGYCKGIENYARHLSGKPEGDPPGVLIDFFPEDFLTIIDESHVSIPQVGGMFKGDRSRKESLVNYGFRLPSALDNRPLKFDEFESKLGPRIYVSATPGNYELDLCRLETPRKATSMWAGFDVVEQIIRPTGLLDPLVQIQPTKDQMDHLLTQIHDRVEKNERVLITSITKQMSEDVADFLANKGVKVRYLHSDIKALERIDILHDLRLGVFDVLVGVNLLREGLDLPEVSLVAILDADKEGFLRNERSLIQTMGRAARNVNGLVIMYADHITQSMHKAIQETQRRRKIQEAHNTKHQITPQTIIKDISDIRDEDREALKNSLNEAEDIEPDALPKLIATLERQMKEAAKNLEFEVAAVLRDKIEGLKG